MPFFYLAHKQTLSQVVTKGDTKVLDFFDIAEGMAQRERQPEQAERELTCPFVWGELSIFSLPLPGGSPDWSGRNQAGEGGLLEQ